MEIDGMGRPRDEYQCVGNNTPHGLNPKEIYAALDRSLVIELPRLEAALAVWEYCEASARYIFGDATGDPTADRILEALRAAGPLNRTDISALFQRNVSADKRLQRLNVILDIIFFV